MASTGQPGHQAQPGWSVKGKSCLMNLISFYDKITHPVDEGKAVDVVYLDFSKAFDTISHSISWRHWQLMARMGVLCAGLKAGWMAEPKEGWWMELHPAGGRSQVVFPRARCWGQSCSVSLSVIWTRGSSTPSPSSQVTPSWGER